ncbi:hypothetical protein [Sulfobacillus harzensis]|uniref:Uncharacterized protein n=1 Tax=Sulfobacillus harzensis TaxID=2729629 RepID=A0A7Y0L2V7_9FIRM|nr:hypothetical protein [Sulfobacillus harzensis]NMP20874.1 hypothetical protein [Sulfobacillus harzensis]
MIKTISTLVSVAALVLVASALMDVGYWVFFTVPLALMAIVPVLYIFSLRRLRRHQQEGKRS